MKESLTKYIDPGIIHFMIYPDTISGEGPVYETLKNIAVDDFFQAVEITWIKDQKQKEKVKKMLKTSHMKVYYGAQPRLLTQDLDLNSSSEEERKKAVATIKEGVDEAVELGAEAIAFLSGKNVTADKRKEATDRLIASINEICQYAKEKDEDLGVTLEVFDYDIDKKALVGPAEIAREVAQEVRKDHNNFGLMADLSHLPLLHEGPEASLLPIKEYLVHVHIGNCILDESHPAYGDSHPRFGLKAGENDTEEVIEFLKVLMDIGYLDGREAKTVSFEVSPLEGESSAVVMANAKRVLKKAWAQL
ncbi:MAG: sugar phosphate isomerase/epimerase family protein [bacterium]